LLFIIDVLAKKFKLPIQGSLKNKKALKFLKGEYFHFKIFENKLNYSRFGVIISNKISKKSFLRNKLKRIIFEKIRLEKFHLKPNRDCLIIVLPEIAKNFPITPFIKREIIKNLEINLKKFIYN